MYIFHGNQFRIGITRIWVVKYNYLVIPNASRSILYLMLLIPVISVIHFVFHAPFFVLFCFQP